MPQVVGAAGERGGGQVRAERGPAGSVPGAAVDRLAEHAAAEQPAVGRAAVLVEVAAEHADQNGRDGDDADRAVGAVLEAPRLVRGPGAGPGTAGARAGRGEGQLPAAVPGQDEIAAAQGDGFFRAQRRVVRAAEERGQFRPDAADLGQDRPDLRRAGDGDRMDGDSGSGRAPPDLADRVGGQQPELDGIAQGTAEHRPLTRDRVRCGGRAVQPVHSPSRAARMTWGSLSWLTGSDARSSQASAVAVTGSSARDRRCGGLKACPYKAARSVLPGGLRQASRVSSGVTVASASARLARECGARPGHFISAYATAC